MTKADECRSIWAAPRYGSSESDRQAVRQVLTPPVLYSDCLPANVCAGRRGQCPHPPPAVGCNLCTSSPTPNQGRNRPLICSPAGDKVSVISGCAPHPSAVIKNRSGKVNPARREGFFSAHRLRQHRERRTNVGQRSNVLSERI